MLERALEVWSELPEAQRYLGQLDELPALGGQRRISQYPEDGLVLRVHSRDLPRDDAPNDWRGKASNRDHAWFRRAELASFLPGSLERGQKVRVEDELFRRLVALHLVDNVRGQVRLFVPEDVEHAELWSEVVGREGDRVKLAFSGSSRAVARGRWPVAGYRDRDDPTEQERGFETELLGRATWDLASESFVEFDLVAIGRRWGGTQYNCRADDLAPTGIGVAFTLASDGERVAPASIWRYGWR